MSRYDNLKGMSAVRELRIDGVHVGFVNIFKRKMFTDGTQYFRAYNTIEEADSSTGVGEHIYVRPNEGKWELWRV